MIKVKMPQRRIIWTFILIMLLLVCSGSAFALENNEIVEKALLITD